MSRIQNHVRHDSCPIVEGFHLLAAREMVEIKSYSFTSMLMTEISVDVSESEYQYCLNLVNAR